MLIGGIGRRGWMLIIGSAITVTILVNLMAFYFINNTYVMSNVRYIYSFEINGIKPTSVAYDSNHDRIIVADEDDGILIYDRDGTLINRVDLKHKDGLAYDNEDDKILVLGSITTVFKSKSMVDVAAVKILDRDGNFLFDFSLVKDHDSYALVRPEQIAYDHRHDRIIAVGLDNRVYVFTKNGDFIHKFDLPRYGGPFEYAGAILPGGRLVRVWDVTYDHNNDRIITADTWSPGYSNIQILNNNGERLLRLAPPGKEEFEPIMSVAYDSNHDRIIVADASSKIFIFDKDGRFITQIGSKGNNVLEFKDIQDVEYDPNNDRIIVADYGNYRVQVLTLAR